MPSHTQHHLRKRNIKATSGSLEKLVLVIAIVEPVFTVPQIYQIWSTKNAQGVSLTTWGFYLVGAMVWLFYGFKVKNKPIIISSAMWVFMEGLVVTGKLLY